ncbi:GntR family frlABCD operon transcriptional regulator [Deinobacterium chartae]|uniref:GntR family frlABCD operon transcriptional regulator n=1 Tax=Deinobacterium chartae TaxID=521158 RepID=A0A841HZJ0_9DEIO|nr:UTRA domain-containing protein [Deinobacterium chartae]MBB6098363.1 GntR family frlABCD operon transcriptional regulator [Deinobacterium chartae]
MGLHRNNQNPLYLQLKQVIKTDILKGRYRPGDMLPPEPQLCREYEVSRITVRRAISELEDEGILEKKQGKGTFVRFARMEQQLVSLDGFTETLRRQGYEPHSQVLERAVVTADHRTQQGLKLGRHARVLRVTRLLSSGSTPLTIDTSFYSLDRFPDLASQLQPDVSTYELLRRHYGVEPRHADRIVTVTLATASEMERLSCNINEPLFHIEKLVFDAERNPIHRSILVTPASRVSFTLSY